MESKTITKRENILPSRKYYNHHVLFVLTIFETVENTKYLHLFYNFSGIIIN